MEQLLLLNIYILIEKDKQPKVNKYKGKSIFTALACLFSHFQHQTAQVISDLLQVHCLINKQGLIKLD